MIDMTDNRNPDVIEPIEACLVCDGVYDEIYEDGVCQGCQYEQAARDDELTGDL